MTSRVDDVSAGGTFRVVHISSWATVAPSRYCTSYITCLFFSLYKDVKVFYMTDLAMFFAVAYMLGIVLFSGRLMRVDSRAAVDPRVLLQCIYSVFHNVNYSHIYT